MTIIIKRRFDILFYGIVCIILFMLFELWFRQYSELTTTVLTVGVLSLVLAFISWAKKLIILFVFPLALMIALIILLIGFPNYISFSGIVLSAFYFIYYIFSVIVSIKEKNQTIKN